MSRSLVIRTDRFSYPLPLTFILLFLLAPFAHAESHKFVFDASHESPQPKKVNIAGDFNSWSKDATPMTSTGEGQFSATVDLPQGVHQYKFVLDGDKWMNDPTADKSLDADDGNGGKNSAVKIGGDAQQPAAQQPDAQPAPAQPKAADGQKIAHRFIFDASHESPLPEKVNIAGDFNDWSADKTPMTKTAGGKFAVTVNLSAGVHQYKFVLDGDKWKNDPTSDKALDKDDGNGGKNSGVLVGPDANKPAAKPSSSDAQGDSHQFIFDASHESPQPKQVFLAGDFNGWSKNAMPMTQTADGKFTATVKLTEGVHFYKFVLDGDKWVTDPNSDKELEADDGNGGKNSAVLIGPDARKLPPAQPNAIDMQAVSHNPADMADCNVATEQLLRLQISTQADDVPTVRVAYEAEPGQWKTQDMWKIDTKMGFDHFGTMITANQPQTRYVFELTDGSATKYFAKGHFYDSIDTAKVSAYSVQMTPKFETPDWAKHAVWYQIFPERFRNGDPSNDPGDKPYEHLVKWTANWWKAADGEAPGDENFYKGAGNVWKRRYGGDVQGLIQALPYLKSLGITAIYLNPMFEADSMHKYDTTDYRHIDEHFGVRGDIEEAWKTETDDPSTWTWTKSDKLFLDFVAQAHAMGFKVILDGVFNHVGRSFWAFQDVMKNGKESKYADWFDIRDWNPPIKYIAWDRGSEPTSDGSLPIFKKNDKTGLSEGARNHIFAITKRWLAPDGDPTRGVDGFRLDVPGDVPHAFWIDWHKLVKSTKPYAYISGELWGWSQDWLNKGDQFDAVMNYRFAVACQDFFVNQQKAITPTQFNDRLNQIIYAYPLQTSLDQMNLFDSHDTDRFPSMFMNPDLAYDAKNRIQDNGPNYSPAKPGPTERAKQKEAVALQMCFVGAPMTYYGDENGMWGPDDPSDRQPMVWKDKEPYDDPEVKFDDDLFAFYQRAIAVREHFQPLQIGFFRPVKMDDAAGVYAFARDLGDQSVYVVINRSDKAETVEIPVKGDSFVDWLDPSQADLMTSSSAPPAVSVSSNAKKLMANNGKLSVELKPYQAAVLSAGE